MHFIWTLIIGLVVGAIAKLLMPGKDPGGFIVTILLGIAGSFIGGYAATFLKISGGMITSFIMAVIGAMLLLGVYRLFTKASAAR